jgi:hypothetical protein
MTPKLPLITTFILGSKTGTLFSNHMLRAMLGIVWLFVFIEMVKKPFWFKLHQDFHKFIILKKLLIEQKLKEWAQLNRKMLLCKYFLLLYIPYTYSESELFFPIINLIEKTGNL